jgi:hypothetical protein
LKVQLESTTKIVTFEINGVSVPARIWEGETESGIPVHAYITRIAAPNNADLAQFDAELLECRNPSPAIVEIPLRMIL